MDEYDEEKNMENVRGSSDGTDPDNRMYRSKYGNGSGSIVQRGTCHSRIVYRKWCRGICTA